MNRVFFVMFAAIATSGCVSTQTIPTQTIPIAPEHETRLSGKSLGHANFEKRSFAAVTPGRAAFLNLEHIPIYGMGNKIIEENKVEDPAVVLSSELAAALRNRYKMIQGTPSSVEVKTDDITQLKSQFERADFLLDVRTVYWAFGYYLTNWARYYVNYGVKVRLIDLRVGNVLAQGFCERGSDDVSTAPTRDELLANGAARLKTELQRAGAHCLEQFRTTVFRLG